jgi:predicted RNA-binding protein associated with RNAse of E/G family
MLVGQPIAGPDGHRTSRPQRVAAGRGDAVKPPNTYVVDLDKRRFTSTKGEDYRVHRWAAHGDELYFERPYVKQGVRYTRHVWVYPSRGITVSKMIPPSGHPPFWCDWYIDIVRAARDGARWTVTDLYMDVGVHEGRAYTLKDVDEVGEALTERILSRQDVAYILHALHDITHDLKDNGYSGVALLGAYLEDMEKA